MGQLNIISLDVRCNYVLIQNTGSGSPVMFVGGFFFLSLRRGLLLQNKNRSDLASGPWQSVKHLNTFQLLSPWVPAMLLLFTVQPTQKKKEGGGCISMVTTGIKNASKLHSAKGEWQQKGAMTACSLQMPDGNVPH